MQNLLPEEFENLISKKTIQPKDAQYVIEITEKLTETPEKISDQVWMTFLDKTRKQPFLAALSDESYRNRWAELIFKILQHTNYTIADMFEQRTTEHPERILFQDMSVARPVKWTYAQVNTYTKQIATFLYSVENQPRVAIFLDNSIDGATADIACLSYGIFDTPLNIHFNTETLVYIFNLLKINIVISDTPERTAIVHAAKQKIEQKIQIIVTEPESLNHADFLLQREAKKITPESSEKFVKNLPKNSVSKVCTTMFTSGSTGMPKGVSFSVYNIVSKRFARAAALPQTGNDETFICYLPLFHTFGRFLELTGSIFWSGTYVLAGNPSAATLLSLFPKINPTGFISVPVRWQQLYEQCVKESENEDTDEKRTDKIRKILGKNLHWGLSAAGFLDPKVFRFFQRNGVSLNSGFGMTETTGGVTMTPPWEYEENSVGKPLPGMMTRITADGELELKSHYLARYLEDAGPDDHIPFPHQDDYWLPTGDIFKIAPNGHHQIIDRVKDIYKNSKGQTVAPGAVEKKYVGVPGIKRTFLVGDGKPYNVLLIVPDLEDPIFVQPNEKFNATEYFHQIVMSANRDLAPYERVVNFSVVNRDFSEAHGELTAKGSFKRKVLEENFTEHIKELYKSEHVLLVVNDITVKIPRWFYRDLGILESDIIATHEGLFNKQSKVSLIVKRHSMADTYTVGDLAYTVKRATIDMEKLVRQPKLWIANPALTRFSPCKESFDLPMKDYSAQIFLPDEPRKIYNHSELPILMGIRNSELIFLNTILSEILHSTPENALRNLLQIEQMFSDYDKTKTTVIRRRLESLAWHEDENIRINAYRILLAEDPEPDYAEVIPAFINSGKTFITEESVKEIARSGFGRRQLDALRKRLFAYRKGFAWPADEERVKQFTNIFKLLLNFGLENPDYYGVIRAEFACWMLLKNEPELSKYGKFYYEKLYRDFTKKISETTPMFPVHEWSKRIVFDEGIDTESQTEIITKLASTHFLKQTIATIYDGYIFDLQMVEPGSFWISRVKSYRATKHYRLSIRTKQSMHFDIHIVLDKKVNTPKGLETLYRTIALSGHPHGTPVIAEFGCSNPTEGIVSSRYLNELTAWDKIRAVAELQAAGYMEEYNIWRKIFIRAMATFYRAWDNSCRSILPGFISPDNVVLPENDFSDNTKIVSLSGWAENASLQTLVNAMYRNFYLKTEAHYPALKKFLKPSWMFHAAVETFGENKALTLLSKLKQNVETTEQQTNTEQDILMFLNKYIIGFQNTVYLPIALFNAIDRYTHWRSKNKTARAKAQEQTIAELFDLYKLSRYPDLVRYKFYRETFFAESSSDILEKFDKLLEKMSSDPSVIPIQLIELSQLNSVITDETEQNIFGKMVFPSIKETQKIDLIIAQTPTNEHVVIRTLLKDKNNVEYTMREPADPSEVGLLYRLFYKENYPKEISKLDKHFVVTDGNEQVIGGLCYSILDDQIVLIDGMAVTSPLHNRGLGSAMMSDFFSRMKATGVKLIKAHFLFGNYYMKHNFVIDKKWGALVKEL